MSSFSKNNVEIFLQCSNLCGKSKTLTGRTKRHCYRERKREAKYVLENAIVAWLRRVRKARGKETKREGSENGKFECDGGESEERVKKREWH